MNSTRSCFHESLIPDIVKMVASNIFRALPAKDGIGRRGVPLRVAVEGRQEPSKKKQDLALVKASSFRNG